MEERRHPRAQHIHQFFEAVARLTREERCALRLSAYKLLAGTRFDSPDDLLHEAIQSVAINSRAWQPSVDTAVFLFQSMRSIASIPRRANKNGKGRMEVGYDDLSPEDQEAFHGIAERSPEEILSLRQEVGEALRQYRLARERLADDGEAKAILEAKVEDADGTETRALLGLTKKRFKAAEERARYAMRQAKRGAKP